MVGTMLVVRVGQLVLVGTNTLTTVRNSFLSTLGEGGQSGRDTAQIAVVKDVIGIPETFRTPYCLLSWSAYNRGM